MASPFEQENAQLRETVSQYEQNETNTRKKFEEMKTRLKEALDEKTEFEIEFLQLQKNFLRVKNQAPRPQSTSEITSDRVKLNKLIAAEHKSQEELKVMKEDNEVLKRQNADLSDQYREVSKQAEKGDTIENFTDDYINSFKTQNKNLLELLEKRDLQMAELM